MVLSSTIAQTRGATAIACEILVLDFIGVLNLVGFNVIVTTTSHFLLSYTFRLVGWRRIRLCRFCHHSRIRPSIPNYRILLIRMDDGGFSVILSFNLLLALLHYVFVFKKTRFFRYFVYCLFSVFWRWGGNSHCSANMLLSKSQKNFALKFGHFFLVDDF